MADASIEAAYRVPDRPAGESAFARALHLALLTGYLGYLFIGTQPLGAASAAQRVEGSPLDRVIALVLVALALVALWRARRIAAAMLLGNLGVACVVGFCALSIAWSDHPDLTLRRALLLVFMTTIAAGIAAGVEDVRRLHTSLFVFLTIVILLNLAVTAADPGAAISDLGVQGIYSQKNVAGIVAMLGVFAGVTWALGAERRRTAALGLAATMPAVLFLLLTRSKTSIGLTVVMLGAVAVAVAASRLGPRAVLLIVLGALSCAGAAVAAVAAFDFDATLLLQATIGDATFTGRDELWSFAWREASKAPWLGHGYGAFWDVGTLNDPLARLEPGSWLGDIETGEINQAHNGYLDLALNVGFIATILATLVVLRGAARGVLAAGSARPAGSERAAACFFAVLLATHLAHNLTEATLFTRSAFGSIAVFSLLMLWRIKHVSQLRNKPKNASDWRDCRHISGRPDGACT